MYLNISLKNNYSRILRVLFIIFLLFSILLTTILLYNKNTLLYGKKVNLSLDNLKLIDYYAVYDMTVISNKNINTYSVEETYDSIDNKTILKFLDAIKNTVIIELKDNTTKISNNKNIANILTQNINNNKNISSFSTFMSILNDIDGSCGCKKIVYEKDNEYSFHIEICNENNCKFKGFFGNIKISGLEVTTIGSDIKNYIIYLKNERNYSKLTVKNYAEDLDKFHNYLDEKHLNYLRLKKDDTLSQTSLWRFMFSTYI